MMYRTPVDVTRFRWFSFFKAGYPTCCESHARHYFMVIWDIGEDGECSYKLSIN